jgi:hypothetical protein
MVLDDPHHPNPKLPAVGTQVNAVLLGYSEQTRQPRLSIRPSDLTALEVIEVVAPDHIDFIRTAMSGS